MARAFESATTDRQTGLTDSRSGQATDTPNFTLSHKTDALAGIAADAWKPQFTIASPAADTKASSTAMDPMPPGGTIENSHFLEIPALNYGDFKPAQAPADKTSGASRAALDGGIAGGVLGGVGGSAAGVVFTVGFNMLNKVGNVVRAAFLGGPLETVAMTSYVGRFAMLGAGLGGTVGAGVGLASYGTYRAVGAYYDWVKQNPEEAMIASAFQ